MVHPGSPSGWTVADLIEQLGDAECHWFQRVVTRSGVDLPRMRDVSGRIPMPPLPVIGRWLMPSPIPGPVWALR